MGSLIRRSAKAAVLPAGIFGGRRPGDAVVLLYHRLGEGGSEIELPAATFERHLSTLRALGETRSFEGALAGGGVAITFDDGTRDFHEQVLPLLIRYQLPAMLYLATGGVDDRNGSATGLTWRHLREAVDSGLVSVGSHTHTHADLSVASEAEAEAEMIRSKDLIEQRLGVPCVHFAYPWGASSPSAERAARRVFRSAALAGWGVNRRGRTDPHRLDRIPILRSDGRMFFRAKVAGRLGGEALLYRAARRGPWGRQ